MLQHSIYFVYFPRSDQPMNDEKTLMERHPREEVVGNSTITFATSQTAKIACLAAAALLT